ncbi:hypothetical protein SBP02_05590 [Pseudomonas benzenivorans]|uniref:Oxidoreductase molybdopterin-binding domain-containing protein n=1 Tax=Pseudomonas benzenivorans TaxID=556533 RepID=A0ABZ0PYD8_9PSED|nr:hypothetical protein [Pseudomonas benzenivorans]WPC06227.1 hypothetical protein SBP02_05590 [Pseudomonas benzenivorans]
MILNRLPGVLLAALLAVAAPLASAQGEILLTVTESSGKSVDFDLATLEAMGGTTLDTHTSWTDGLQRFTGVRADELLEPFIRHGATVRAVALNGYEATMSLELLLDYPAIIAYKRNGQYMAIRDKGPLWMIFPLDEFPELKGLESDQRMVWQLRHLVVE